MFYWQRYKLSGPFRYLKRFIKFTGNFLEAFEKKSQLKTENFVRIFLADVQLHFSKYQFSRFSWYILCSVCCMAMILYWRKDMSSTDVPDTLDLYMKLTKKFLGIFEKSLSLIMSKNKNSKSACNILKNFLFSAIVLNIPVYKQIIFLVQIWNINTSNVWEIYLKSKFWSVRKK